jgi:DNA-binding beta-propeller fold protein YncE
MALRKAAWFMVAAMVAGFALAGCGGEAGKPPSFVAKWDSAGRLGKINRPEGIGIGNQGQLLVADTWNDRILLSSSEGDVAGSFGEFGEKPGNLQCPRSVWTDKAGNIYVVDSWNHRIEKFSPTGRFLLAFGSKGGPWGYDEADGKFTYPYGVAVDSQGFIYVSDFNNNRIQKFDPRGKFKKKWGTDGRQDGQFSHPAGLAIDSNDRLYVADVGNGRIQAFTTEGDFDGKFVGPDGEFDRPYGVAVDSKGDVYVAEMGASKVQKFTSSGKLIWSLEERGGGDGELDMPLSVAVDGDGFVYVSDWGNNRIQKFAPPKGG